MRRSQTRAISLHSSMMAALLFVSFMVVLICSTCCRILGSSAVADIVSVFPLSSAEEAFSSPGLLSRLSERMKDGFLYVIFYLFPHTK